MKAVLFDLEGTIVESAYQKHPELIGELRRETREELDRLGVPEDVLSGLTRSFALRNRAFQWADDNLGPEGSRRFRADVEAFMLSWDMRSARQAVLYPDTLDALTRLSDAGVAKGIVTNTSAPAVDYVLDNLGLARFFGSVVSRSDVPCLKPDPAMIRLAASRLQTEVGWLVGDALFDAGAARNAGIESIIIRRDGVPPDFEHDRFIGSLRDVYQIVVGGKRPPESLKSG